MSDHDHQLSGSAIGVLASHPGRSFFYNPLETPSHLTHIGHPHVCIYFFHYVCSSLINGSQLACIAQADTDLLTRSHNVAWQSLRQQVDKLAQEVQRLEVEAHGYRYVIPL